MRLAYPGALAARPARRLGALACLLATLGAPPGALADTTLPPVWVPTPDDAPGETDRAPSASVTIVRPSEQAGSGKTLADLIRQTPGATVRDYGGLGQLCTVSFRGTTTDQVLVLLDGVPLTGASATAVNLASVPTLFVERLELFRGSLGASFGPGALGGVVNIVTGAGATGTPDTMYIVIGIVW